MSLSSKGCIAKAKFVKNVEGKGIVAEITTYRRRIDRGKTKYVADFKATVLFYDKGEQINTGDFVKITGFYIRNCNDRFVNRTHPSYVITEWAIVHRNSFVKRLYGKSKNEYDETARRQRQAIEEEIEAEEQDLDEYIENNGDEDLPF